MARALLALAVALAIASCASATTTSRSELLQRLQSTCPKLTFTKADLARAARRGHAPHRAAPEAAPAPLHPR